MSFLTSKQQEPSVAPGPTGQQADPTYFLPKVQTGQLLGLLIRRGWIVILMVALGGAGAWCLAGKAPKMYRSTGSVYVSTQAPQILDIRAIAPEESQDLEQMRSVEQGMTSSMLLLRLINDFKLADDPTFAPPGTGKQTLAATLAERVHVELNRGTRIIGISVDDTQPQRASELVNALVNEYESWTTERQQTITQQASEGLAREEARLRDNMEDAAQKLQDFREANPVPGLESPGGGNAASDELETLSSALSEAKATRLKLESDLKAFQEFQRDDPNALAGIEQSDRAAEVLAQVRQVQEKEAEFAAIKQRYLELHPVYKSAASELAKLKENLSETATAAGDALKQRYQVVLDREAKLKKEVDLARGTAVDVEGIREQFRVLSRNEEAVRTLHDAVALRLRETTLASTVPTSVLRWQDAPMVPDFPHSPRKVVYLGCGVFAGGFLSLILVAGLELGDKKVRNSATAARALGAPLLVTIPPVKNPAGPMLLVSDPNSATSEAFRLLSAALAPSPGGTTPRTVLFGSAMPKEGRSFCAVNYATALAMQGHRTLLLDADMRSPGLSAEHLSNGSEAGLGKYLAGESDAAAACFSTALPNLYLLSSGPMRSDASELLAGTRLPALLEDAYKWFDRVVIDTPPATTVSDMLAMVRYADRCCMVAGARGSDRRRLRRTAELTRSAGGNLVGFIWNEMRASDLMTASPVVPVSRVNLQTTGSPVNERIHSSKT